jgi:hypothetical protein
MMPVQTPEHLTVGQLAGAHTFRFLTMIATWALSRIENNSYWVSNIGQAAMSFQITMDNRPKKGRPQWIVSSMRKTLSFYSGSSPSLTRRKIRNGTTCF